MKIGFTGTQNGLTKFQKELIVEVFKLKDATEFVHGDCIGADSQAADIAVDYGISQFTVYPPIDGKKRANWCFDIPNNVNGDWRKLRTIINYRDKLINIRWMPPDTYLNRNRHIVDNVEWMIACPKEHKHSVRSATWTTIRYCWKIKRELTIIPPIEIPEDDDIQIHSPLD